MDSILSVSSSAISGVRHLLVFYALILTPPSWWSEQSYIGATHCWGVEISDFIRDTNSCIPVGRRTLIEHADSNDFSFRTKDGSVCEIGKDEIELLSGVCTEQEKLTLRLPIFISTDPDAGAWKVDGTVESEVVSRILGKVKFRADTVRLHNPDMRELRRLLPNATFMVFTP